MTAHGTRRVLKAPHGAIILSLARQAKVDALPGEASLWLTLPMYSSSLRSANRMLGVTQEAMEKYSQQMRGQSEAQLQSWRVWAERSTFLSGHSTRGGIVQQSAILQWMEDSWLSPRPKAYRACHLMRW